MFRTIEFVPQEKNENYEHFNMFRKLNIKTFGNVFEQFNMF